MLRGLPEKTALDGRPISTKATIVKAFKVALTDLSALAMKIRIRPAEEENELGGES